MGGWVTALSSVMSATIEGVFLLRVEAKGMFEIDDMTGKRVAEGLMVLVMGGGVWGLWVGERVGEVREWGTKVCLCEGKLEFTLAGCDGGLLVLGVDGCLVTLDDKLGVGL